MPFDLVLFDDLPSIGKMAKELGCGNYLIARDFPSPKEADELKRRFGQNKELNLKACKIFCAPSKEISAYRGKADFTAFFPRDISSLNFAVNCKDVDLILHPFSKNELLLDSASARIAGERGIPIAFLFSEFLVLEERERSLLMKNAMISAQFMQKFDCKAFFLSGARKAQDMRAPEDMAFFAELFGFEKEKITSFMDFEDVFFKGEKNV